MYFSLLLFLSYVFYLNPTFFINFILLTNDFFLSFGFQYVSFDFKIDNLFQILLNIKSVLIRRGILLDGFLKIRMLLV